MLLFGAWLLTLPTPRLLEMNKKSELIMGNRTRCEFANTARRGCKNPGYPATGSYLTPILNAEKKRGGGMKILKNFENILRRGRKAIQGKGLQEIIFSRKGGRQKN